MLSYHPPVAGGIFWERQLFHRLKDPVLIFQEVKELKNSQLKLLAFQQYLHIAKQMKNFEQTKFNSWIEKACPIVTSTMKKSILKIRYVEHDESALSPRIRVVATGQTMQSRSKTYGTSERLRNVSGGRPDMLISKQSVGKHSETFDLFKFINFFQFFSLIIFIRFQILCFLRKVTFFVFFIKIVIFMSGHSK